MCGIVQPAQFPELAQMQSWLQQGYAGEMQYLHDARRQDPGSALDGTRSIIVCALNYNSDHALSTAAHLEENDQENVQQTENGPRGWISRYAWGRDYHEVVWEKLNALQSAMRQHFSEPFESRGYSDTGPVAERVLARYAGLGWLGKNTLLLNEENGSWFFLGAILTTLDLHPSIDAAHLPPADRCGSCTKCLDACPTEAFVGPYVMDARRCISYLTIELRGSIPEQFRESIGWHIYGCDICQDVCPWNRKAPLTAEADFAPRNHVGSPQNSEANHQEQSLFMPSLEWLAGISETEFREIFRGSAIKRTKWRGLVRNACIALGNSSSPHDPAIRARILSLLHRLRSSTDPAIAESAQWALSRISPNEPPSG